MGERERIADVLDTESQAKGDREPCNQHRGQEEGVAVELLEGHTNDLGLEEERQFDQNQQDC